MDIDNTQQQIEVIGRNDEVERRGGEFRLSRNFVSPQVIGEGLTRMTQQLSKMVDDAAQVGRFPLEEVTFHIEISTSGRVALIGSGIEGGMSAAVELKFSRPKQP